ncbi:MAG: hypothetical protein A3J79_14000 [Elusimicrobia bacterium RIFOXYB2_FULL_62_6]|nr:MAG: hypothetical protein A3J79_14000 [Elusimicrobia bacterium RIFOXYB2_FULL_62_6]
MTQFRIARTRRAADLRACAALMAATDPWLKLGLDHKACLKNISAPLREVYAARAGGKIAGVIVLQMTGTFRGYIQTVCVAAEARGLGLGTRLVKHAEKRIFRESPNAFLCVSSFNRKAQKLYKKLGYAKIGLLKDFVVKGCDEILMRKTLGSFRDFYSRQR